MITEFIWDFDGMLFDTYPHTTAALCEYLKRYGKEADEQEVFNVLKISIREAFNFFGVKKEDEAEFYEIEHDFDFEPKGVPYEGIPEILRFITENGGRNYLFTHRDRYAIYYLERYGLKELFSDFITREEGFPLKPAPDAINYLVEKHKLKKESCIMLGDRAIDCDSGLNAGIKALLFDEFHSLKQSNYTYYANTVDEVSDKIKDIMK